MQRTAKKAQQSRAPKRHVPKGLARNWLTWLGRFRRLTINAHPHGREQVPASVCESTQALASLDLPTRRYLEPSNSRQLAIEIQCLLQGLHLKSQPGVDRCPRDLGSPFAMARPLGLGTVSVHYWLRCGLRWWFHQVVQRRQRHDHCSQALDRPIHHRRRSS